MLRRMPLTEDIITSQYRITGYHSDAVLINDQRYQDSLIVSAEHLVSPWPVRSVDDLNAENLQPLFKLNADVILLGTGQKQQFPAARIMGLFGKQGIGLEVMDNGALCRTFNILVAEDRAVVAAILLDS